MKRDLIVKGRGLGGSSDLTLLAPIKPEFIRSLESVTQKTRIKRVLEALHGARQASHENHLARLLSDAVERVGAIHSVRVAVLEPEDKVLLAVTFDGSWDSYIRVLWEKVGTLLDLIFHGTIGYKNSRTSSFEEWMEWARGVQVETGFYYGPPDFTARDLVYHRRLERMRQRGAGTDVNELLAVAPSPERLAKLPWGDRPDDAPPPPVDALMQVRDGAEKLRFGLQGLAGLYRLADLYRPDTPNGAGDHDGEGDGHGDGEVLRYAGINLLKEFVELWPQAGPDATALARVRFARQLDWLFPGGNTNVKPVRPVPPKQDLTARAEVQGGIVRGYDDVTHGLAVMVAFPAPQAAEAFLAYVKGYVTTDASNHKAAALGGNPTANDARVLRNLAFTYEGLRAAGMTEDDLEQLPEDFRQGMVARAGALGDVRINHPRRWKLPSRFAGVGNVPSAETIDLGAVHAVLQLRCLGDTPAQDAAIDYWDAGHPLRAELEGLLTVQGLQVLAIQSLRRRYRAIGGQPRIVEHFGFADGDGQPVVTGVRADTRLGEVILGYNNAADVVDPAKPPMDWLYNGSFLVMRKYRQNVGLMRKLVAESGRPGEEVYRKMMGRDRDGKPLIPVVNGGGLNDFDYESDPRGEACPLHSHIRRANPRQPSTAGARPPRVMRRSMSYGPVPPAEGGPQEHPEADRGLLFMAYNASISEQFEVVQRWLVGGNSTGSSSGQSCPIVGVPENGQPRSYRYVLDAQANTSARIACDTPPLLLEEPTAVTRLEWGVYLFTPSISALDRLRDTAKAAAGSVSQPPARCPWKVVRGEALLKPLIALDDEPDKKAASLAWKAALEDPESIDRMDAASLWAAIRQNPKGLLRTSYGVLVVSRDLQLQIYADRDLYSVSGQRARMNECIGDIFLGKDDGADDVVNGTTDYREESKDVIPAIMKMDTGRIFDISRAGAARKIRAIVDAVRRTSLGVGKARFEVTFEAREVVEEVLADLAEHWFGLKKPFFERGGTDWNWKPGVPPLYPGHLTALSRYLFQPNPGGTSKAIAKVYGAALTAKMTEFVQDIRSNGEPEPTDPEHARITKAARIGHTSPSDDQFVAEMLVGILMGLTPTIMGAVYNILKEWARDGSFAALRSAHAGMPIETLADAQRILGDAIAAACRMRPMPQLGWRTVRKEHVLGNELLKKGDILVLAHVSGTHQSLAEGKDDGRLMFGGTRKATGSGFPTHACPGYGGAMAAMCGILSAFVDCAEDLRPGPATLIFEVQGPARTVSRNLWLAASTCPVAAPTNASGIVLPWGDSWLGYIPFVSKELRDWLESFNYTLPETYCGYFEWLYLERMATKAVQFREEMVERYLPQGIKAILLSAGGNDSVGATLEGLLNPQAVGADPINAAALTNHIARLRGYYEQILDTLGVRSNGQVLGIPIILHGYDHPIPAPKGSAQWIRTPFWNKGYKDPAAPGDDTLTDVTVASAGMRTLIDALNKMLADLATQRAADKVRYVKLTGTAAAMSPQGDPAAAWFDNLHPHNDVFRCMAAKIAAAI